ncbi:S-layer homology domain-containing protein [Propioniciclava soli]|uniref:S-layer homology domain-containing protein n=1 Tax=Propioniciclava soli TaxID=2775081 RepID=A0ABZ3C6I9_9ACTN
MTVTSRASAALLGVLVLLGTWLGGPPTARAADSALAVYADEPALGTVELGVVNEGTAPLTGCEIWLFDDWNTPWLRLATGLTLAPADSFETTLLFQEKAFVLVQATCDQASHQAAFTALTPAFPDVPAQDMFHTEVMWLAANDITTGYPDGTFRPGASVNRDAMAAFLHRMAGRPVPPAPGTAPFADVAPSDQFAAEIGWLAATGITTGYPDGTFRPVTPVNRDAMAAFVYRFFHDHWFAGTVAAPTPPTTPVFVDVATDNPFHAEIAWLASSGIATGWEDGTFRPLTPIARDAMAAFLFRLHWLIVANTPDDTVSPLGAPADLATTRLATTGTADGPGAVPADVVAADVVVAAGMELPVMEDAAAVRLAPSRAEASAPAPSHGTAAGQTAP